jgi:hypothetical protein
MSARQLALFAVPRGKRPAITAGQLRLAPRTVRVVTRPRAVREDELPGVLGCHQGEPPTAIGIAVQWRRIARRGSGFLVPASRDEERRAA